MTGTAAVIGGGVVGGGWAARFLLMGWDVRVFDPDPEAERKLGDVLAAARRAMPGLFDVPLPAEGRLSFHSSAAEAVRGAVYVQESVPERLEAKQAVYAAVEDHALPDAVIGSSTSGFKPSELQAGAVSPGRIVVAHPFVPVYLLPLVELVATDANPPETVVRAEAVLRSLAMHPLRLRHEIDAHIADRLLESVWREALWLVRDGVATTAEIDDAIRYGFGLRWAQMGLFEGYRIAGGEAGMRHFIGQFGPALNWPWTRLTDVPELDAALVETIAAQSDEQSGARDVRALEAIRDANLVAILRALKGRDWGAGALLKAADARIGDGLPLRFEALDPEAPVPTLACAVPLDWADADGRVDDARALEAVAAAGRRFFAIVTSEAELPGRMRSVETAMTHHAEIDAAAPLRIETLCLEVRDASVRIRHELRSGRARALTVVQSFRHADPETGAYIAFPEAIAARLRQLARGAGQGS